MKERNKFLCFLDKIFRRKTDKEKSDALKKKMCFNARASRMCNEYCLNCAWRVTDD